MFVSLSYIWIALKNFFFRHTQFEQNNVDEENADAEQVLRERQALIKSTYFANHSFVRGIFTLPFCCKHSFSKSHASGEKNASTKTTTGAFAASAAKNTTWKSMCAPLSASASTCFAFPVSTSSLKTSVPS